MTGTPNAASNRRSAEGGSGAEADRTKRTRAGGRAAGGSVARMVIERGAAGLRGRPQHGQARRAIFAADDRHRPGHVEHRGQGRRGRGRIERDHDPARGEDGDQGGGVFERVRQPDGHAGPGRYPGAVQAPGPGAGAALQASEGQLARARGIFKVGGASPASRRLVDPVLEQRQVPFFS